MYHINALCARVLRGALAMSLFVMSAPLAAQRVEWKVDEHTNRLTSLSIKGDKSGMNWLVQTDGTQYGWIFDDQQWGNVVNVDGTKVDGLSVRINRQQDQDDLVETYVLQNTSQHDIDLGQVQILTPWNDNYPDAFTALNYRCHAHVWPGERAAYTYALRMNGQGPHLGMMLEEGSIAGYAINERDMQKGGSNTRGIIGLVPEHFVLQPGRFYMLRWRIFCHQGADDFFRRMVDKGGIYVEADRYTARMDDTIRFTIHSQAEIVTEALAIRQTGRQYIPITFGKGKPTHIEVFGYLNLDRMYDARANFIFDHQQDKDEQSLTYGAYLPFNLDSMSIVRNWQDKVHPRTDLNEGRERLGMGLFMAQFAQRLAQHPERSDFDRHHLEVSLKVYDDFVHKLQDADYRTWGTVRHTNKQRLYNYPWVARFYSQMFEVTHQRKYLTDAYRTMMAFYQNGGQRFYAIGIPVRQLISQLRGNRMRTQADSLFTHFTQTADYYVATGLDFPKSEVNYEQSIIAPAMQFLCEMYLLTGRDDYLACVRRMMPALEAFNGRQPSCHLNEIAIRHWDGFWFGMPQMWGDTFPHYWSCLSAEVFALYAGITGDNSYRRRAEATLLGNLINFDLQGRAHAAWHYPDYVNGVPAQRANPCANDQDWALYYLMTIMP